MTSHQIPYRVKCCWWKLLVASLARVLWQTALSRPNEASTSLLCLDPLEAGLGLVIVLHAALVLVQTGGNQRQNFPFQNDIWVVDLPPSV